MEQADIAKLNDRELDAEIAKALGWISCSERLPQKGTEFIGYEQSTGYVFRGQASWLCLKGDAKAGHHLSHPGRYGRGIAVTHWLPFSLPEGCDK